jgi:hypothetical protein
MMTLDELGSLGEFLGALAVVASLVYLAFQIRQNTRSVKINTFQALAETRTEFASVIAENREVSTLLFAGLRDFQALEEDDRIRFGFLIYKLLAGIENQLFQYRQAELPQEQFEQTRGILRWYARAPGFRAWWKDQPVPFGDSLTKLVEDELRAAESRSRVV